MSYEWDSVAFRWKGQCDICSAWTRSGVRESGRMRFRHLCAVCAVNHFAGEIVSGVQEARAALAGKVEKAKQSFAEGKKP